MRLILRMALATAVAAWTCAGIASGAPASTSKERAKLERQQAAETARAKTLKSQAQAAVKQEAVLKIGLADVNAKAVETKNAAFQAEGQAAALQSRRLTDAADLARDRRSLELTIAALIQRDAAARALPLTLADARAGAVAGLSIPPLAHAVAARTARLDEAERLTFENTIARADLDATGRDLASQREITMAMLTDTARKRVELLAESERAAKKAAALGRQAKNLQDLAARVSPSKPQKAGAEILTARPTGPHRAPTDGRIVTAFGAATPGGMAKGVTIRTAPGAKIVAPASATIGYAGVFRSYGQVVILDQGNGYSLVLTGLQNVLAQPGKKVLVGEIVGEMPSGSASLAPELYFEVREAGRAVDPERWLKAKT